MLKGCGLGKLVEIIAQEKVDINSAVVHIVKILHIFEGVNRR